ncbi:MAG: NifB/NifX family molybdenum-iron cluster-binding protein [Syntrophomonadaceae bacterium]|nr:NifB/NifX family molybdenum-iron cluster-binding protein [Syntrophomonadaceae bacterium]
MKIAIPVANQLLCQHFGHCDQFALVEVDETRKAITGKTMLTPPPHEPGVLPRWLAQVGANVVIAGGMGSRAQTLFNMSGIEVIVGAPVDSPDNIVKAYLNGTLVTGENTCNH